MHLNKKKISNGYWSYIFFFIALEPAALQYFKITDTFFMAAQTFMFCILILFQFAERYKGKISNCKKSKIITMLIIYYAYLILVTYLHNGRTKSIFMQAIQFIGFVIYLDIVLRNNPKALFQAVLNILTFYLVINCFLIFTMPEGLYNTTYFSNNWLLGYDNQNINFILPTLLIVLLKNEYYKSCKVQIIFTYLIAWITEIKVWSAMSLVVVLLMTLLTIFCFRGKNGFFIRYIFTGKIFNCFNLIIVNIIAFFALVIFRLQYYFEYLIIVVLKRNLTLTSRIYIWDKTIDFIKKNPIWGYGKEVYTSRAIKFGYRPTSPAGLHAHNRFLETIYSGGIILLGIYLYLLFYAANKLKEVKETTFAKILSFGIFIYLVGMLTEYYDYCLFFWGMLVIAENAEEILKK